MAQCQATTNSGSQCQNDAVEGADYCYIESHCAENDDSELNEKRKRFCKLFVSEEFFGNGAQSYIEAYDLTIESQKDYNSACASASRLLSNVKVCDYINELLDDAGLNDNFVDKQLLFMLTQNADYTQKMAAIREYNKVKGRITNKHDIKSDGQPIGNISFNIIEGDSE
jgi:phage terminase small subunit